MPDRGGIVLASNGGGAGVLRTDAEMPVQVEDAYQLWLDAAGRNVYETARILGARRQTLQEWS
jgi:hypothetical protein